jgi:hypothetical protein
MPLLPLWPSCRMLKGISLFCEGSLMWDCSRSGRFSPRDEASIIFRSVDSN